MVKRRWRGWIFGLAVVLAIALQGCPWGVSQSAKTQNTMILSVLSDPKTFNTVTSQEINPVFGFIEEGLVGTDGITGEVIPALAESWEFADNNQTLTFTLRKGLRWSDGKPLTTDDVLFTYNDVYLNEEIPADFRDLLKIGDSGQYPKITKLDDRRVQFKIPEPFAPFLRYCGIGLLPKHILASTLTTRTPDGQPSFINTWGVDTPPEKIVGSGPYQLTGYRTAERVLLKRNPYYWRKDAQGKSQPYIENIVIQVVENQDTQLLQFRSGSLDITDVSAKYFSLMKSEERERNFKIYNGGPSQKQSFLAFNMNRGRFGNGRPVVDPVKSAWFNNREFRQAIALGINRQQMLNNIFQGIGAPQESFIQVQSPYYLSPEEGLPAYKYDPAAAKAKLQKAGFRYNSQKQLIDAKGNVVAFTLYTNAGNQERESMGAQIKQDLAALGIQVDFQPIAFNTLVSKISNTLDWDCYLLGFQGGGLDPNSSSNVWKSDGGLHTFNLNPRAGQRKLVGWQASDWEKEIDQLFIKGAREVEESKRKVFYDQVQRLVKENVPYVYLVNTLDLDAIRDRVQGVEFSAIGGATWNIYEQSLAP
jgi:peptide/nickel transport system substrate-binding protein